MKLGAVRKIDLQGRIQIPADIRSVLKLDGIDLNVYVNDRGEVIISKLLKEED